MATRLDADIIVVAAGLSGLAAICSAAEGGANVIAFEKANTAGGAANMGMGPCGVGSRVQRYQMVEITPGEIFRKHMFYNHYKVDARLVRDYYYKSGETIDWLESIGVEFAGAQRAFSAPEDTRAYSDGEFTWHVVMPEGGGKPGPRCASAMNKKMIEHAAELGAKIYYETPVYELIKEDGKVVGVRAKDKTGEEYEAYAKAVILATGGFGANPQMIKEECGYTFGEDIFNFAIPGITGDGLKMAWAAGAGKTKCSMELMYQIPNNVFHAYVEGAFRQPCFWCNRLGRRFMPEDQIANTTFTGNAISVQPGRYAFTIFDEAMLKRWKKKGPDIVSHVHPYDTYDHFDTAWKLDIDRGYEVVFQADTLEELAEKAGIDKEGLLEEVEEYNEMCENGFDEIFEKDRRYMIPLKKGPFYCLKQTVGGYGSLGGILVNHKMEVMDKDYNVIPGFYAVGVDACNIYGDSYTFTIPGNTMGFCLNSGRIAGENACEYIGL